MRKIISTLIAIAFLSAFLPALSAQADTKDDSPVAGGIFPPLQYPPIKDTVYGLRMSPGWARNAKVYGLDMGLIGNITDQRFIGTALAAGFNSTSGDAILIFTQMAGIANSNFGRTHVIGIQIALGYNYNEAETDIYGSQMSLIGNFGGKTNIYGAQFGFVNYAQSVYGFQIGLVNHTKNLTGIQIGLMNFASDNWLAAFPVINIGF